MVVFLVSNSAVLWKMQHAVSCAVHVLVFIVTPCLLYVILQSDGKAKAPCFFGKKMPPVCSWRIVSMVLPDHKVAIPKAVQTLLSLFKSYHNQGSEYALQTEDSHL